MLVRNQTTGDVVTEGEFRALHSNTSFPQQLTPEILAAFGYDPVLEGAQPSGEPWQYAQRDGVEEINSQWFTKYILAPVFATQEEEDVYVAEWQTQQGLAAAPIPRLIASGVFSVTGEGIDGAASGIAMIFAVDVGQYWVFFNEPQVDLSYAVYTSVSAGQINVTARAFDYVELSVRDGGVAIDPSEFSVNIVRPQ